eukprot:5907076-Amphidinium_carterae.1
MTFTRLTLTTWLTMNTENPELLATLTSTTTEATCEHTHSSRQRQLRVIPYCSRLRNFAYNHGFTILMLFCAIRNNLMSALPQLLE